MGYPQRSLVDGDGTDEVRCESAGVRARGTRQVRGKGLGKALAPARASMEATMTKVFAGLSVLVMAAVPACASYPAPVQQLADAEAAERTARESGADADPQGQLHLKLAQEEIAQAKQLMASGDNDAATSRLVRARSDAELALQQARTDKAMADANRTLAQVQQMRASPPASTTTTSVTTTSGAVPVPPPATTSTTTTTTTQSKGGTP